MTYEGEFTFTVRWSYERRIGEKASFLFHKDGDNIVKKNSRGVQKRAVIYFYSQE